MFQSQHDQTNKMAQAQISQGIRPVWSESFSSVLRNNTDNLFYSNYMQALI